MGEKYKGEIWCLGWSGNNGCYDTLEDCDFFFGAVPPNETTIALSSLAVKL